jgi:hypothetical protein
LTICLIIHQLITTFDKHRMKGGAAVHSVNYSQFLFLFQREKQTPAMRWVWIPPSIFIVRVDTPDDWSSNLDIRSKDWLIRWPISPSICGDPFKIRVFFTLYGLAHWYWYQRESNLRFWDEQYPINMIF